MSFTDLEKLIKENRKTGEELKITLVVLVFPNSTEIASVFANEGVDYVIAFKSVPVDNIAHIKKYKLLAL